MMKRSEESVASRNKGRLQAVSSSLMRRKEEGGGERRGTLPTQASRRDVRPRKKLVAATSRVVDSAAPKCKDPTEGDEKYPGKKHLYIVRMISCMSVNAIST